MLPRARVDARARGEVAAAAAKRPTTAEEWAALASLVSDVDNNLEYGFRGGHVAMSKLLATETDEDVLCALDDVLTATASRLPPGMSWPLQPTVDTMHPPLPAVFRFACCDAALDALRAAPAAAGGGERASSGERVDGDESRPPRACSCTMRLPEVWIRAVPSWLHRMRGQEDVGQLLWPAAPVLAQWLALNACRLRLGCRGASRMLEIGAGMGLTGIAAGLIADAHRRTCVACSDAAPAAPPVSVVLTDFMPVVLHNLAYNAELNDPVLNAGHRTFAAAACAGSSHGSADDVAASSRRPRTGSSEPVIAPMFQVSPLDWSVLAPPDLAAVVAHWKRIRLSRLAATSAASVIAARGIGALMTGGSAASSTPSSQAASPRCSTPDNSSCDDETIVFASGATVRRKADEPGAGGGSVEASAAGLPEALRDQAPFDLIIGSDMVCCVEDAYCVAGTIARFLRKPSPVTGADGEVADRGGLAIIMLPPNSVRWGIESFSEALASVGLAHEQKPLPEVLFPPVAAVPYGAPSDDASSPRASTAKAAASAAAATAIAGATVAGGYERELSLWFVRWPAC